MDNLAAHKVTGEEAAIVAAGGSVWYLPPYSPDLNPIEKLWSKTKAWLRLAGVRDFDSLMTQIAQVLHGVTADECGNYSDHAGYFALSDIMS